MLLIWGALGLGSVRDMRGFGFSNNPQTCKKFEGKSYKKEDTLHSTAWLEKGDQFYASSYYSGLDPKQNMEPKIPSDLPHLANKQDKQNTKHWHFVS